MRGFLTGLIPKKMDNRILCRVLKRIWVSPQQSLNLETVTEEQMEHENNTTANEGESEAASNSSSLIEKAKAVAGG